MPIINVSPRTMLNGDVVTSYSDTVGTSSQTFNFLKTQETVILSNKGSNIINYTIGSNTGSLNKSEFVKVVGSFDSVILNSSQGTQAFDIWAEELNVVVSVGGGSPVPNTKYLDDYVSYSAGNTDWIPAFAQAFTDLGPSGGVVQLGAKQYNINSLLTIPSNVHIRGINPGVTTIKLNSGANTDMVTLSNNQNCGVTHLTIYGNAFDAVPSTGKNGLVIGKAGLDVVSGTMNNIHVYDIYIRSIGGTGFYCFPNTWVYAISRMNIDFCTEYGAYIQSTDNEYDTINITGNNKWGLYVTGSNNRFTSSKIIFNGRGAPSAGKYYGNGTDINSAGAYITGKRNTFVNIEAQENYGHGFVFDGASDTDLVGLVSDKNGYTALAPDGTSVTGTPSAVGYYFMNGASRITGMVKATNFNSSLKSQLSGYYVDQSCVNISLEYEQDANIVGANANLSYTSLVTSADTRVNALVNSQYDDLLVSGMALTNQITATDATNFSLGTTFVQAGYTISGNDIYGSTNWANTPRLGTPGNKAITAGTLYLVRVKVKPDINNYYLRLKAMYNDGAFETINTVGGNYPNSAYSDISFVIKAPRAGNLLVFVEDKVGTNNATQGAFHMSEMSIVDITAVNAAKYHLKTADQLVKKNYFLGTRTFT
jgi:hypothetical protein